MWLHYVKENKKDIASNIKAKMLSSTKANLETIGKDQCFRLTRIEDKETNRYLVASKPIKAGQLILTQPAIAFAVNHKFHSTICHNCFCVNKLKVCSACNVLHSLVCKLLQVRVPERRLEATLQRMQATQNTQQQRSSRLSIIMPTT